MDMSFKDFDIEIQDNFDTTPEQYNGSVTTAGTPITISITDKKIFKARISNQRTGTNGNANNTLLYVSVNSETAVETVNRGGYIVVSGSIDSINIDSSVDGAKYEVYLIRED